MLWCWITHDWVSDGYMHGRRGMAGTACIVFGSWFAWLNWIVVHIQHLPNGVCPSLMQVQASEPGDDAQESLVPDRMAVEDVMVAATSVIVVALPP